MTATLPPPTATGERRIAPQRRPARPVGGRRRRSATRGWNALAVLISAIFGFPIYWMLITSLKTSTDINQLV
ncbi:MAG: hypothetical protein QOC66_3450, partial [Pseudonocardiales bacterium]|nr:hypothetical protein [Pseudonocardiales bacterium]